MPSGEFERLLQALLQPKLQQRVRQPAQIAVEYQTLGKPTETVSTAMPATGTWNTSRWGEFTWSS